MQRAEQDRIKAERDALLASREDLQYAERKEAESLRGDLIADMYESLRPQEEGYDERMVKFLGEAPPSVQNDPVFREVLTGYTRMADKAADQRRQNQEIDLRTQNQLRLTQERAKYNDTMRFLQPEDYDAAPKDENGQPDPFFLGMKAMERKRAAGVEDTQKKTDIKVKGQMELLDRRDMDDQQKAVYDETEEIISKDTSAFPRRADKVVAEYGADGIKGDLVAEDALRKAKEWDKDLFENEVLAARNYATPEQYIALVPDLTPTQQQYRRRVWEYANTYGGKLPPKNAAGTPTPPAPAPATPTATADGKVPDVDAIVRASVADPTLGSKVIGERDVSQANSNWDVTEQKLEDGSYLYRSTQKSNSSYPVKMLLRYGKSEGVASRLDGPSKIEVGEDGKVLGKEYAIDGEVMSEQNYWKDPRVIEYAKAKGVAPAPAGTPTPPAPAPAAPATKLTPEAILQKAPAGSQVFPLPDGSFRVRFPDGSIKKSSRSKFVVDYKSNFPTLSPPCKILPLKMKPTQKFSRSRRP